MDFNPNRPIGPGSDFLWTPMTPAKPVSPICTMGQVNEVVHPNWLNQRSEFEIECLNGISRDFDRDFDSWEAGVGLHATSQLYGPGRSNMVPQINSTSQLYGPGGSNMVPQMNSTSQLYGPGQSSMVDEMNSISQIYGPANSTMVHNMISSSHLYRPGNSTMVHEMNSTSQLYGPGNSTMIQEMNLTSHGPGNSTMFNEMNLNSQLYGPSSSTAVNEMNDLENWTNVSFGDLLALAHAGAATQVNTEGTHHATEVSTSCNQVPEISHHGSSMVSKHTFDLNSPPRTGSEVLSREVLQTQYAPITPESGGPHSQLQETHAPDKGAADHDVDLTTTPQPKSRRKKHRPKVVIEGQSKSARKPRTPKTPNPDGTVPVKRKYVRKTVTPGPTDNGTVTPGPTDNGAVTPGPTDNGTVTPSHTDCRTVTPGVTPGNTDYGSVTPGQTDNGTATTPGKRKYVRKNKNTPGPTPGSIENEESSPPSKKKYTRKKVSRGGVSNPSATPLENDEPNTPSVKRCLNFDDDAQVPSSRGPHNETNINNNLQVTSYHSRASSKTKSRPRSKTRSIFDGKPVGPATPSGSRSIFDKKPMGRATPSGSKRQYIDLTEEEEEYCSTNVTGDRHNSLQEYLPLLHMSLYNSNADSNMYFSAIHTLEGPTSATSKDPSVVDPTVDSQKKSVPGVSASHYENGGTSRKSRVTKKSKGGPTQASPSQQLLISMGEEATTPQSGGAKSRSRTPRKRQTKKLPSIAPPLAITWGPVSSFDEMIERFSQLNLNVQTRQLGYQETQNTQYSQNALVIYQRDGSIVPYKEPRKRKPRAKVNLDDETSRVWKLLLEDINSEGINGTDEEKAKWWENERTVFQGRTDSFIARMHLVQGDRRFSPWKGSVVDSVVGVFLTQNVSDHLSSSAFMSLGALYPIKPEINLNKPNDEKPCIIEEPEPEGDERIAWHEKSTCGQDEAVSSQNSVDSSSDAQTEKSELCFEGTTLSEAKTNLASESKSFVELLHGVCNQRSGKDSFGGSSQSENDVCVTDNNSELSAESVQRSLTEVNLCPNQDQEINTETQILNQGSDSSNTSSRTGQSIVEDNPRDPKEKNVQSSFNIFFDSLEKSLEKTAEVEKVGTTPKGKNGRTKKEKPKPIDWDNIRKEAQVDGKNSKKTAVTMDSVDWEAIRQADVKDIAEAIKARGMNNKLAERIKGFLDRIVSDHGSIDLEWLRDVPPDKAKEYLLSIRGLGLKSVECVRLLTLHHLAFPVDTNVGRIAVRLGWVPLQPLPESLQLHLLEMYPVLESIQQYLWPRLCKLDQRTLYELHYQMITFGKVFCTKSKPNCNACPMRGECRHFASAFASARFALPAPEENRIVVGTECSTSAGCSTSANCATSSRCATSANLCLPPTEEQNTLTIRSSKAEEQTKSSNTNSNNPIIEVPASPEPTIEEPASPEPLPDIEDFEDPDEEIPTIKLNMQEFTQNLQKFVGKNMELQETEMSNAMVALSAEAASIPAPKLKYTSRLRTEHHVYELPDSHELLQGLDRREPDDPSPYLLSIWTPGETADSVEPPENKCNSQEYGRMCDEATCFSCNSLREANTQTVRGTLLIPCRTAMRGSFPLNGTYFQVNEVFADHASSINPIDVPRSLIWNLPRRTVYFGTSASSIFRGLNTEEIQYCFWRGFLCVRGFEQATRVPRPLVARFHFPASKMLTKTKGRIIEEE